MTKVSGHTGLSYQRRTYNNPNETNYDLLNIHSWLFELQCLCVKIQKRNPTISY